MLVMCSVVLSSCDSKSRVRREIAESIAEENRQCPTQVPGMGEITSMGYEDDNVVFKMKIDMPVKLSVLQEHEKLVKTNFVNGFVEGGSKKLSTLLIQGEVGMKIIMMGGIDNGRLEITISPEEIKQTVEHPLTKSQMLDNQIESARMQLPIQVDEITTMVDVKIMPDRVQYVYEVADYNNEVEYMSLIEEQFKANMISGMSNPAQEKFAKLLIDNNKSVEQYYIGTKSDSEFSVLLTVSDLRQVVQ